MKASELKKGDVAIINGENYAVKEVQVQSPSSRSGNTLYKVQYRHVITKNKLDQSYKGNDDVETVELLRRPVQLLFCDQQSCTFMDMENYTQHTLDRHQLENELPYLVDGIEGLYALIIDDNILGIELPATVEFEILECAPAIKGASASARTKPATVATGLTVQVPEYIAVGDKIKVNSQTGDYMSRA